MGWCEHKLKKGIKLANLDECILFFHNWLSYNVCHCSEQLESIIKLSN